MFKKTIENTSPKRQRVNEPQSVHSLALRIMIIPSIFALLISLIAE